jgi:hypothetical protein
MRVLDKILQEMQTGANQINGHEEEIYRSGIDERRSR